MPVGSIGTIAPEIALAVLALAVLVLDLALPAWRKEAALAAGAGMAAIAAGAVALWQQGPMADFGGAIVLDNLAVFLKLVFLAAGVIVVMISQRQLSENDPGEYFSLVVFFVLALCVMASAGDLVIFYLGFELSSICGYLLAAWRRGDAKSNEAGLKYFVYGAAASGFMLYGLTLLYGAAGSLRLDEVARALAVERNVAAALGAGLVLVGLGYKMALSPFHWWAPDVYEGAPTPVTAFLSVGPKVAGFALLLRAMDALASAWAGFGMALAVLAALTMFTGNLIAIRQTNIKRMLAYSSIAHAGYMLIGAVVGLMDPDGIAALAFYAVAYLLMNLGAFAVAEIVEQSEGGSEIERFAGLAQRSPVLAAAMVVFLLSLTGVPPTAGFVGKLWLFGVAIKSGVFAWLAIVGIINSAISLYYYMNVARFMYYRRGREGEVSAGSFVVAAVAVALVGTVALCLLPQGLMAAAEHAARSMFGGM